MPACTDKTPNSTYSRIQILQICITRSENMGIKYLKIFSFHMKNCFFQKLLYLKKS